jgi:3-deoxy-D-arabino-heptulosonate 7-phosphate (DAHP) synthase
MNNKTDSLYIFGPCSLESLEQITPVAALLKRHGLTYLRTQLFKPRTNPDSFQGLGKDGLEILQTLRKTYKKDELKFVCEACSSDQLEIIAPWASVIQIGARNMQNFELLKGDTRHPSLHFKKVGKFWSARIGIHYRAIAVEDSTNMVWFWIGHHSDYDQIIGKGR